MSRPEGRESAETTVHAAPSFYTGKTPCCGLTGRQLAPDDRVTADRSRVTCRSHRSRARTLLAALNAWHRQHPQPAQRRRQD